MNKNSHLIYNSSTKSFNDYQPKRFGLRYNPSMIILEYLVPSSGKLYHHKMRVGHKLNNCNENDVYEYLYKRHEVFLNHNKVNNSQILNLIKILKNKYEISKSYESKKLYDSTNTYNYSNNINLNKLSTEELNEHKTLMEVDFSKNAIKPGHPK